MKPCKQIRQSFLEALYNELDHDERTLFDAHLESCIKCRKAFRKMKRAMGVMSQRVRVEPDQRFWDDYWARLEERMQQEKQISPARSAVQWQRWLYRAAAVLFLIGAGVLMGRLWVPSQTVIVEKQPDGAPIMQAKLDQRTANFLGRSEVLLLGLVHYEQEGENPATLDLSREKAVSQNLIQEASYLKRELAEGDDRRLEKLVSDLELILLQIANLEEKEDLPEIELVKSGVDRKGLLLKINLEQMKNASQRAKPMSKTEL